MDVQQTPPESNTGTYLGGDGFNPDELFEIGNESEPEVEDAPAGQAVPPSASREADSDQSASSESASTPTNPIEDRLRQYERQTNELSGAVRALLSQLGPQKGDPNAPPVPLEKLRTDGEVDDLLRYVDWMVNQRVASFEHTAQSAASRAAEVAQLRGQLTSDSVGSGRDYDSMVSRYITPLYDSNPGARDAIHSAASNPAVAEYVLAVVSDLNKRNNGDLVKTVKAIYAGLDAYEKGYGEAQKRTQTAMESGANKILKGAGNTGRTMREPTANELQRMSDSEFERFLERTAH